MPLATLMSHLGAVTKRRCLMQCGLVFACVLLMCPVVWAKEQAPLEVVASFSILGDMVKQVGGETVNVDVIVGPESDAHAFEPRPSDAKVLATAELLFLNGLEFEAWLPRLVQAAGYEGKQVILSEGVTPIQYQEHGQDAHDEHHHGDNDPHAWQSLDNAVIYVENIRDALISARPEASALINANAARYLSTIHELSAQFKAAFTHLPAERRKVISSHDAFAYLAAEYGIEFITLLGVANQAEPSAKDIAAVIDRAKAEKISAVFVENVVSPKLVQQVARETGAKVGGVLYSDALARPPHEADSYLGMMRWNAQQLLEALKP